ncbi:MAG: VOC family protein [Bacteroidota bacterium]
MAKSIQGIHHITALASDASKNIEFYVGILGLRLVKVTVNPDDPSAYHLFYGNETGRPGTILSFFCYPHLHVGQLGKDQVHCVALSIPKGSPSFWKKRLKNFGISYTQEENPLGESLLQLQDPDGLSIALIVDENDFRPGNPSGMIKEEKSIRGIHHLKLCVEGYDDLDQSLKDYLDHKMVQETTNYIRLSASGKPGDFLDITCKPYLLPGKIGLGAVHHVSLKTPNTSQLKNLRKSLVKAGFNTSLLLDRRYYHAFYFREMGGILFEIATQAPGFSVDESLEDLGKTLKLPAGMETRRKAIEKALPKLIVDLERFEV